MYDHTDQESDPTIARMTAHHTARTAAAISACLKSLADEADQAGLDAVASFIDAAACLAAEEARRYHLDLKPFGRPNLVWSVSESESAKY